MAYVPARLPVRLGFDTATEIGVLAISAAQASQGAAFSTILIFPMLFTAGMSLMDFTDRDVTTCVTARRYFGVDL
ncbi:high-affinity nickel permease [Rhizobium pisi]